MTNLGGAAGSLIVLLLWVYYASQILFFGAEITQVVARRDGRDVKQRRFRFDGEAVSAGTPGSSAPAADGPPVARPG